MVHPEYDREHDLFEPERPAWARPATPLDEPPAVESARFSTTMLRRGGDNRWKALTAAVGVIGGAALIVLGTVAIARADLKGSFNLPIVEVAGWPHSPLLGILEIIAGAALVVVSLSSIGELLVSAVIAGFGALALIEPEILDDRLTIDSTYAWLLVALGGVGLLAALVTYVKSRPVWDRSPGMPTYLH